MKKWAILLYGLGISGGANVIYNHANFAQKNGVEITIVSREKRTSSDASWHKGTEKFIYATLEEVAKEEYDVAIATEWRSAYDIYQITAKKYLYFVQSIESRFFSNPECLLAYIAENTYEMPLEYITEANWINKYLNKKYNHCSQVVLNGIDKDIFNDSGSAIEERPTDHVRVLVEGSIHNWLKNVPKTIQLCREAGVEEIWLVTPDDIQSFPGVDRVFSKIPLATMPEIYRSCDLLVKLSLIEGMFGPPLEMFHCGGTAITYDIEGSEEYLVDGYNSIIVRKNDDVGAKNAIRRLLNDPSYLKTLKQNAKKTAENWCDWDMSSKLFFENIDKIPYPSESQIKIIKEKGFTGANAYCRVERLIGIYPNNDRTGLVAAKYFKEKMDVYIYGAGKVCKNTLLLLSEFDIPISGILVTNTEGNPNTVLGHKVYCLSDLKLNANSVIIYISTEKYYFEIVNQLHSMGYVNVI